jgi:hypothetical protein
LVALVPKLDEHLLNDIFRFCWLSYDAKGKAVEPVFHRQNFRFKILVIHLDNWLYPFQSWLHKADGMDSAFVTGLEFFLKINVSACTKITAKLAACFIFLPS